MKKMIILTEGQTEQIFVVELLQTIAEQSPLRIETRKLLGGRKFETIEMQGSTIDNTTDNPEFYILILDCAADGRVISALKERYDGLVAQGYEKIIIVRDLRPDFEYNEKEKAIAGFAKQLPQQPICPIIVVATMEVETWFIWEIDHFARIDPSLNYAALRNFGVEVGMDFEEIQEPADLLEEIYKTVGVTYKKSKSDVKRTVDALEKSLYTSENISNIPSIKPLIEASVAFLTI